VSSGIVVGGFFRSGTSVVRRLLDGHSRVFCGPEAKLWMDIFGWFREDPLDHLRLSHTLRTLGADDELLVRELGGAYVRVLDQLAAAHGKARWADKAPENVLVLDRWATLLGDDFPFVHCVRDPRDTVASAVEAHFVHTLPTGFDELLALYTTYLDAGLAFEAAHPDRTFRLRYEDLVATTATVAAELMAFLGEPFEAAALDLRRPDGPVGLEDPKIGGRPEIDPASVGRHRDVLSAEQVHRVEAVCGDRARRLGYEW
jgi:hypothetical protein